MKKYFFPAFVGVVRRVNIGIKLGASVAAYGGVVGKANAVKPRATPTRHLLV